MMDNPSGAGGLSGTATAVVIGVVAIGTVVAVIAQIDPSGGSSFLHDPGYPDMYSDYAETTQDTVVEIDVTENDLGTPGEPMDMIYIVSVERGTAFIKNAAGDRGILRSSCPDGQCPVVVYIPESGFLGRTRFEYGICTGEECNEIWASVLVLAQTSIPSPTSTIDGSLFIETGGGGRCDPLAKSVEECEDGEWIAESGECDCSVVCPRFTLMQNCNAHRHWTCLWVGDACYSTTDMPITGTPSLNPTSTIDGSSFIETGGGGRCDPLAKSFEECEDGEWIAESGECDCTVVCPRFTLMQNCNAHRHWTCLWVGNTCCSTTTIPVAVVQMNSFCRSGPSMIYDKLTTFVAGTDLLLSGYYQHPDGTIWWNVVWPDTSTHCWISAVVVDVCGALEIVPLLTPPPTPTPRPQQQGGNGGLTCNMLAQSEAECGDGLWDCSSGPSTCECVCEVLCPNFTDQTSCQAHSSWFCSWNGSACVGP